MIHARKDSTLLRYFSASGFDHPNLQYGRAMEPLARKKFEDVICIQVLKCGLVIKRSQPWLCCSPDGLIRNVDGTFSLLEIKCPVSNRNSKINVNYITNGNLNKKHCYFTQLQVQMYVCNVAKCHFFVFSEIDYVHLEIEMDPEFLNKTIPHLESIYFKKVLPSLLKSPE
jgi:hypothetical protein